LPNVPRQGSAKGMDDADEDEILATVSASTGRRWLGLGALHALAFLLIFVAFRQPPALGWQVFLLLLGGGALWLANAMRKATARRLYLSRRRLFDSDGVVLAEVANITGVDRGLFAFKPSNGFLLRLAQTDGARVWCPGMWWRMGRNVGVGGVTSARETKPMSEILTLLLQERTTKT